jgi:hypothetical protein
MNQKFNPFSSSARPALALAFGAALVLSACGGGTDSGSESAQTLSDSQVVAPLATGATTFQMDLDALPAADAALVVQPLFHAAPALLPEPVDDDIFSRDNSARRSPHRQRLGADMEGLSSRRLTLRAMKERRQSHSADVEALAAQGDVAPLATGGVVSTYTPAQIRAAYGLPALPALGVTPTAAQAAQMGAGQTIYIVNAMHNPNTAAELAAFNQKFGLPTCTTKAIATNAVLPLAAASKTGCELSIVYSTVSNTMTSVAPAYDSGWATEIALDVQWAHATAPLARIIVIEAPDASVDALVGGIKLANAMGPGVVSMSFGATEGNWTASVDAAFTAPNMSYLAATGDSGAAVSWPSVSNNVVAVGGTSLNYSGTGARSEVSWSGTGGGTSAYTTKPVYQTSAVPGLGTVARRTVADVAFNADPNTGQYVAVMTPGSTTPNWISAGGTSLSTPQWAGLLAVANASRALAAKPVLGAPHAVLYGQISTVPGTYASAFADITQGLHGSCATCAAKTGYDALSGLGTPNVTGLLSALSGVTAPAVAPTVAPAGISGKVGTPLSFTVSATAPNAMTYTLSGAPSGMAVSTSGVVTWATPVAGTYKVTVTAKDTKTALTGQGLYTVTIAAPAPPVVAAAAISGKVGAALSFTVSATAPNPMTYTLSGAPAGMAVNAAGVVSWATPVAGTYKVTVTAKDTKTALTGQGLYTVAIAAPLPPVVSAATVNGRPAAALSFTASVVAPNPVTYTLAGAPAGMSVSSAGLVSWASPVIGSYQVRVSAKDTKTGLSGTGVITVKIAVAGPVITAPAMTGVAGKPLSGTISITAPGSVFVLVSINNAPWGMGFSMNGLSISAYWPSAVAGSYTLKVTAVDSAGLTATATVPVTIK